jgi:hypothetical protein
MHQSGPRFFSCGATPPRALFGNAPSILGPACQMSPAGPPLSLLARATPLRRLGGCLPCRGGLESQARKAKRGRGLVLFLAFWRARRCPPLSRLRPLSRRRSPRGSARGGSRGGAGRPPPCINKTWLRCGPLPPSFPPLIPRPIPGGGCCSSSARVGRGRRCGRGWRGARCRHRSEAEGGAPPGDWEGCCGGQAPSLVGQVQEAAAGLVGSG